MARWSKLQKLVRQLISPDVALQIHCSVYPMDSQYGHSGIPRYWITLDKEIIWDYPRQFVGQLSPDHGDTHRWPHANDISDVSMLIREYVDTPRAQLLDKVFEEDRWGLADILRAADKRIGVKRLRKMGETIENPAVRKVLAQRFGACAPGHPDAVEATPLLCRLSVGLPAD